MPEAVRALIGRCFARGAQRVWCAHAEGNDKSRRVIEKCGFQYRCTEDWVSVLGDTRATRYYAIEREDWEDQ